VVRVFLRDTHISQSTNQSSSRSTDTSTQHSCSQWNSGNHWTATRNGQGSKPNQQATYTTKGRANPSALCCTTGVVMRRCITVSFGVIVSHYTNLATCKAMIH